METNIFSVGIIAMAALAGVFAWNLPDMLRSIIGRLLARVAYIEAGQQAAAQELERWAAMQGPLLSPAEVADKIKRLTKQGEAKSNA